jgi:uncharacterized protein
MSDDAAKMRGMSGFGALWWASAITLLFLAFLTSLRGLRLAGSELLGATVIQVVCYSAALFALLRVYAPESSIRAVIALRAPSRWSALPLALILGPSLYLVCNYLYELVLTRWPLESDGVLAKEWEEGRTGLRVALVCAVVFAGPLAEEVIFRGAMFSFVRRYAVDAPAFSIGAILRRAVSAVDPDEPREGMPVLRPWLWEVIAATSVAFILVHLEPRRFLPLVPAALALGWIRARTGSLLSSVALHASFNATPFLLELRFGDTLDAVPSAWSLGAAAVAVLTLALTHRLVPQAPAESP